MTSKILIAVVMSLITLNAKAGSLVSWPIDKQAHFLAGYGIGLSSALVYERIGLPIPGFLGFITASLAGYVKEKSDSVFDSEDMQKTIYGSAAGTVFFWTIHL